MLENANLTTL